MNNVIKSLFALSATALFSATGCYSQLAEDEGCNKTCDEAGGSSAAGSSSTGGTDSGSSSTGGTDSGTTSPTELDCSKVAPVTTSGDTISVASDWITGSPLFLRWLNVPAGMYWPQDTAMSANGTRWQTSTPSDFSNGTYHFSYVTHSPENWGQYGANETCVRAMQPAARAWLWCYSVTKNGVNHINGCELCGVKSGSSWTPCGNASTILGL